MTRRTLGLVFVMALAVILLCGCGDGEANVYIPIGESSGNFLHIEDPSGYNGVFYHSTTKQILCPEGHLIQLPETSHTNTKSGGTVAITIEATYLCSVEEQHTFLKFLIEHYVQEGEQ